MVWAGFFVMLTALRELFVIWTVWIDCFVLLTASCAPYSFWSTTLCKWDLFWVLFFIYLSELCHRSTTQRMTLLIDGWVLVSPAKTVRRWKHYKKGCRRLFEGAADKSGIGGFKSVWTCRFDDYTIVSYVLQRVCCFATKVSISTLAMSYTTNEYKMLEP